MRYDYECKCGYTVEVVKPVCDIEVVERCICGKEMRRLVSGNFHLVGTRDNFGIKNAFYDTKTGKDIDTWKNWEKAGFRDPLESNYKKNPEVKNKIKYHIKNKRKTSAKAVDMAERF